MLNIKKYINKHEVQFCVENIDSSLFVKLNGRYKESNMSNHILFEITDGRFISENKYNAASKPRNDTITTAIRLGFKPFIFYLCIYNRLLLNILQIISQKYGCYF